MLAPRLGRRGAPSLDPCLLVLIAILVLSVTVPARADDVVNPGEVEGVTVTRSGDDVVLGWTETTADAAGGVESVDHYNVYRGLSPDFAPDKTGGSNLIGSAPSNEYTDVGAAGDGVDYYYLVTAVDLAGNESASKPAAFTAAPVLSGQWTDTSIDLTWTDAEPVANVATYKVYWGEASGVYEFVEDVGLVNSWSLTGVEENVNWYIAVTAVDQVGNESEFSNEHVDPIGGAIELRAHDESYLCWGVEKCQPQGNEIDRHNGWQKLVPTEFPEGEWTSVVMTFTMDSRLCDGTPEAPDRCGSTNPGGWNPCGDPWDRTVHVFAVLDEDCVDNDKNCIQHANLELLRTISPFGTDAPPPDGNGNVPPRVLSFDITPFAPLLAGQTRWIGAEIVSWTPAGWWVTTDFRFSKRPEEASPKPPADGFQQLFFGGVEPPTAQVTVPAEATSVFTRLFITGHGGDGHCDGGDNDGDACEVGGPSSQCPGGSCENCDEFCHRENQILVDGAPVWQHTPWRDCCWPRDDYFCQTLGWGGEGCKEWNSCGHPSCSFARAGWCPGEIACHYNLDEGCDQDLDMTAHLAPGGTYDVDYNVLVKRGSWSVSLVAYWYED